MNIERFVDELFSLISDERNRRILARCADGPKTLKVLNEGVGNATASRTTDKRQRTVEKDMNRMRVLGLLDGTPDTGWTLVASEVRDLIAAVRRADDNSKIFNALANQTVRAVLAAMLGPEKTRTELRVCGDTADISNAIGRLTDLGVIEKINDNPKTWRRNAHAEPWMEVLARANLLVHALLDGSARRAARQGAHALSEPGVVSEDYRGVALRRGRRWTRAPSRGSSATASTTAKTGRFGICAPTTPVQLSSGRRRGGRSVRRCSTEMFWAPSTPTIRMR